jgi:hypothetical protein
VSKVVSSYCATSSWAGLVPAVPLSAGTRPTPQATQNNWRHTARFAEKARSRSSHAKDAVAELQRGLGTPTLQCYEKEYASSASLDDWLTACDRLSAG